jgi:murein DD-endopeptidase MepM/ murein hydrolase activator NlpD
LKWFEKTVRFDYNIRMKRCIIYIFVALLLSPSGYGQVTALERLHYTDENYNLLYGSTVASKNRILRETREEEYSPPRIYSYTMKLGEDIWTIIAKTSLNIDTIATLNRIDFIGMIHQDVEVYIPDTLGIFFEAERTARSDLAEAYGLSEDEILTLEDPAGTGAILFFVPEKTLSFLERVYLTGVVFHAPLMGRQTSKYGVREDPFVNERTFHGGVDISAKEGKLVRASRWGTVRYAGEASGYGNLVVLEHELGYYTLYAHLSEILVETEENVDTGQALGKVGSSGRSTGFHLHFEIRRFDIPFNPENIPFFLESASQ